MALFTLFLAFVSLFAPALAAFGVTTSTSSYVVDAGSSNPFIVTISRSSCDITSIKYRGEEFQYSGKGSHISSGLGSATVSSQIVSSTYAKITCVAGSLTHYIIVKSGESSLYMGTYFTEEPSIGEARFIARLDPAKLPLEYPYGTASTTAGSSSTVEGSDVFVVNGQTRSKFYSSQRFIDDKVQCVYRDDDAIHACMILQPLSYEGSSGGPFFRDINTNNAGDSTNLYFYMNSNHAQTESYRMGFHGPYQLQFSRSGIPTTFDASFFADLGLSGYVATSGRGYVKGTASGVGSSYQKVLHWYNSNAQYWVYASSNGAFTSPAMKPGTYTQVLYQDELKVATDSVTVTAGGTVTKNIASTFSFPTTLWTIGDWDGQPFGFRNADKIERMHPSDSRMSSWGPLTYTVGSSALTDVPMALFKGVNTPLTIKFTLTSSQLGAATLRIGTTLAFASGRPQAKINSYTGTAPAAPTKIDSRGVTRGTYRGLGEIYTVSIPAGTLVAGSNTITIDCISGSSGDTYLNPNFILDAIDLYLN
ncbi:hypothetical protein SLS56_004031 [Neofusicoccum ribis]|uniref:Rhamnogalacturonate lyase n=1 Tax=Neofusicoccum ribis TaxID=45134 RepID=A0ABR3SXB8_9PEZI